MKSRTWQKRAVLFLLVVYSVDLAWKVANWHDAFGDAPWWGIALGLIVRFSFMGFMLFLYLRLKKLPQDPLVVTAVMKRTSVRSMRIIHGVMFAAIVSYVFIAERLPATASNLTPSIAESFAILAFIMVVIAVGFRRKMLSPAIESLGRDPGDEAALGRWRMANLLSMVLTMSVALYGFALRALGGSRRVVWPFFIISLILMLMWRPRLDAGLSNTEN